MRQLPRILQIVAGFLIFISLFTTVSAEDGTHQLIWKVLTPTVLQTIAWIGMLLLSIRLMYGKLTHDGESSSLILKGFTKLQKVLTKKTT
jgi:hypothetical protein